MKKKVPTSVKNIVARAIKTSGSEIVKMKSAESLAVGNVGLKAWDMLFEGLVHLPSGKLVRQKYRAMVAQNAGGKFAIRNLIAV